MNHFRLTGLFSAIRFLTILPLSASPQRGEAGQRPGEGAFEVPKESFGAAWFPAVGLGIGAGAWAVDRLLGGAEIAAIAVVVFWMVITGGMHYDGLADTFDGLGGRSREERLRIMADGSIGTFGVLALVVAVLTELVALSHLVGPVRSSALLLAPALGRWAMIVAGIGATSARPEGLGDAFVKDLDGTAAVAATLGVAVAALLLAGGRGFAALAGAAAAAGAVRGLGVSRLGGVTGDVLGAAGLAAETLALVVFSAGEGV